MKKYAWLAVILAAVLIIGLTILFVSVCKDKKDDNDDDGGNEIPLHNVTTVAEFKTALQNQKDGDVLTVKNGTYALNVVITKNIKIIGESKGGVIISGPEDYSTIEKFDKIGTETWDFVGIVAVKDCNAEIRNVTIKGVTAKTNDNRHITHDNRYAGVININSNLTMENVDVLDTTFEGANIGVQNGYGVYAVAPANSNKTISIKNCKFENFNKGGVYIKENYKELIFTGNEIKGYGLTDKIGQNGLLFACKSTIKNNHFKDLKYDSETVWSVAIFAAFLTEETFDECVIDNNQFTNVQKQDYQLFNS